MDIPPLSPLRYLAWRRRWLLSFRGPPPFLKSSSICLIPDEIRGKLWSLPSWGFSLALMCSLLVNDRAERRWQNPFWVRERDWTTQRKYRCWCGVDVDERCTQAWYKSKKTGRVVKEDWQVSLCSLLSLRPASLSPPSQTALCVPACALNFCGDALI